MKKWVILFVVVSTVSLSIAAFAAPDVPDRGGPEAAMPPSRGIRPPGDRPMAGPADRDRAMDRLLARPEAARELGLTDEQASKLKALHLRVAKAVIPLRGAVELAELELREALSADSPDEAAVMAAIDRVHQARAELQKAQVRERLATRQLLGPDTLARLRNRARVGMIERRDDPQRPAQAERRERRQQREPARPGRDRISDAE